MASRTPHSTGSLLAGIVFSWRQGHPVRLCRGSGRRGDLSPHPVTTAPGSGYRHCCYSNQPPCSPLDPQPPRLRRHPRPAPPLTLQIHPHALGLRVLLQRVLPLIPSETRLLEPAERQGRIVEVVRVDPHRPRLHRDRKSTPLN